MESGSDSTSHVDITQSVTFGVGAQIATMIGITGLTNEATLETNGNLITA